MSAIIIIGCSLAACILLSSLLLATKLIRHTVIEDHARAELEAASARYTEFEDALERRAREIRSHGDS